MNTNTTMALAFSIIAGTTGYGDVYADPGEAEAISRGEAHYLFFCANCHGALADGNGPYSKLLKIVPTDLTNLGQTGEDSVTERVLKAIVGRHEVGEGQESKMPIFSDNLEVKTVYEVTEYIKSIQK